MQSKSFLIFALISASLFVLSSADYTCSECVCTDRSTSTALKRGDSAPICWHFLQTGETSQKVSFSVKVDEYSSIVLNDAQAYYVNTPTHFKETFILMQTDASHFSTAIPFMNVTNSSLSFYTNIYSLVIRLDNGHVTSLIWDNTCAICPSTKCMTATVGVNKDVTNLCDLTTTCSAVSATCNPKIYISWVGTDSAGNTLTSAGLRLSRFVQYSITDLFRQAQGVVNTAVTQAKNSV